MPLVLGGAEKLFDGLAVETGIEPVLVLGQQIDAPAHRRARLHGFQPAPEIGVFGDVDMAAAVEQEALVIMQNSHLGILIYMMDPVMVEIL